MTAWTPEPLTPFDEITARLPQLSALQAVWNEAEELLQAAHPEGFDVLEIGRLVWERLPEQEKPAALDALFYCWFEALMSDREARNAWAGGGEHA